MRKCISLEMNTETKRCPNMHMAATVNKDGSQPAIQKKIESPRFGQGSRSFRHTGAEFKGRYLPLNNYRYKTAPDIYTFEAQLH